MQTWLQPSLQQLEWQHDYRLHVAGRFPVVILQVASCCKEQPAVCSATARICCLLQ
jgi:hypothetical protein